MKINNLKNVITIMFFSILFVFFNSSSKQEPKRNIQRNIRVLLSETDSNIENIFEVKTDNGILLQSPNIKQRVKFQKQKLSIIIKGNNIYLQSKGNAEKPKKISAKEIKLTSLKDNLILNNQAYQGEITLKINGQKNKLYVINTLNLEDYIYSVLVSESYQYWPLEMQKVQAIVSRTYAIYQMNETRKSNNNKPYDLKNNNFHQTYNGLHNHTHLREAIAKTHNMILIYNSQPVLAMFDACCGGIIPAKMKGIDFTKAPYLARTQKCEFCKNYKLFKWHKSLSKHEFLDKLKASPKINAKFKDVGWLIGFRHEKDRAGIVKKVKFVCTRKNFTLTGHDLLENAKDIIKSLNFNLTKTISNRILIDGNGFGHQIGLCQHGARELVRKGWNLKKILSFYYPETELSRLKEYA